MFVARDAELRGLERMYAKQGFQMAVIYGRRRVGKTALIDEFVRDKRVLYFTAQQKTAHVNLALFTQAIFRAYGLPDVPGAFASWDAALDFIVAREIDYAGDSPLVFVFDEFPYAAEADAGLPSVFQSAIDHGFKDTNVRMILCGSNEGFMESEVLGAKSPLYGRRTMQIHVEPFDYLDAARMLPGASTTERVSYYAAFGGTPYYLAQIDRDLTFEQNVEMLMFDKLGMLYEEPLMLLREELREPAQYNSVLDAIGAGDTTLGRIADHSGVNQNSVGKYLRVLMSLGILERVAPYGENERTSRKARYRIRDPFFSFWYRFVSKNVGQIEEGNGPAIARSALSSPLLSTHVGKLFETICRQWLVRENIAGRLPFTALEFGQWWGADPAKHEETDIDLIAANRDRKEILLGECKWRNSFDETAAVEALECRAGLIGGFKRYRLVLFSKMPASHATVAKYAEDDDMMFVSTEDLYRELAAE